MASVSSSQGGASDAQSNIYERVRWGSNEFEILRGWGFMPSTQREIQTRIAQLNEAVLWYISLTGHRSEKGNSLFLQLLRKEKKYLEDLLVKKNV